MTSFNSKILSTPLLPDESVGKLLSGNCYFINKEIEKLGITVQANPKDGRLPVPVRGHIDLQCCQLCVGEIITSTENLLINGYNVKRIKENPYDKYPGDCLLNCFIINGNLIAGKNISHTVTEKANDLGYNIINVNQGYAKCSCALIQKDAVITADKSIANTLLNIADVLLINEGEIELPGYNYGFIGGCCGKISNDKIIFAGNPYRHSSGKDIVSFIEKHGCSVLSLSNDIMYDFGGFIPLEYK